MLGDWRLAVQRGNEELGHLWENYFIAERRKCILVAEPETRMFFWRTTQQQEVDLIEESATGLKAYETKWNQPKSSSAFSKAFRGAYPEAALQCVTPSDYVTCLLPRGSLVSSAQ